MCTVVRSVDGNQKLINVIIKSNGVNLWPIIIKMATNFRAPINHVGPKQERFRTYELYDGFIGASRPKAISDDTTAAALEECLWHGGKKSHHFHWIIINGRGDNRQ